MRDYFGDLEEEEPEFVAINLKMHEIIGKKYGKWTVLAAGNRQGTCKVECECGSIAYRGKYALLSGETKACERCKRKDRRAMKGKYFDFGCFGGKKKQ